MKRLVLVALVAACDTRAVSVDERCRVTVDASALGPVEPLQEVTLPARPMSTPWDTRARLGGLDAQVTAVARTDCLVCDSCRADAGCDACDTCAACTDSCATCVETLTFVVPETIASGPADLLVFNRNGASGPVRVTVAPGADTAAAP
jgi:hypothetical protein